MNTFCPVFQCGIKYEQFNIHTPCPRCNISEYDIRIYGTNDRFEIYKLNRDHDELIRGRWTQRVNRLKGKQ